MKSTKITVILYATVLLLTFFLLYRSSRQRQERFLEHNDFEQTNPIYTDHSNTQSGNTTRLNIEKLNPPLLSFTRGNKNELWISSWNGENATSTGITSVTTAYNSANDRFFLFSGISSSRALNGALYVYDSYDGSTASVATPNEIGDCVPSIQKITFSPDGEYITYYLSYVKFDTGKGIVECNVHPIADNGYYSYKFETATSVYIGKTPGTAVWSNDSRFVYIDDEIFRYELHLPKGKYKIDIDTGNAQSIENSTSTDADSYQPAPYCQRINDTFFCPLEWVNETQYTAVGISSPGSPRGDLYLVTPSTQTIEQLTKFGDINCP